MRGNISKITFESEGYSAKDWIEVLEHFEKLSGMNPEIPEDMSLSDFFEHEENNSGATLTYNFFEKLGYIHLEYSPYLRSEHGVMFRGSVSANEERMPSGFDKIEAPPEDYRVTSQTFSEMNYLRLSDFEQDLPEVAYLEIPENPDEKELYDAVGTTSTIVDMIYDELEDSPMSYTAYDEETKEESDQKSKDLFD